MFKLPAYISKAVKVQPNNVLDLKVPEEEVEISEGHEYGITHQRGLHSIQEESLKGTYGGSRPSTGEDTCTMSSPSIKRIRKEVKFLRILVGALLVVSTISLVLNIWIIHRDGKQGSDSNSKELQNGKLES